MARTKNKYTHTRHTHTHIYQSRDQRTVSGKHVIVDRFKPVTYNNTQSILSHIIPIVLNIYSCEQYEIL